MVQHFNGVFVLIIAFIFNTYVHTSMNCTWNLLLASIIVDVNVLQWQSTDHLCNRLLIDLLFCVLYSVRECTLLPVGVSVS